MRFQPTPKQIFVMVSLALITVIGATTSVGEAVFFRQAIIQRESKIIDDVVDAVTSGTQGAPPEVMRFRDGDIQAELRRRFGLLKNLPGAVRIKVFNSQHVIVWSDDPDLIGTGQTLHPEDLQRALDGEIRTIFDQMEQIIYAVGQIPPEPLIEFYVPFVWDKYTRSDAKPDGAVALYRSPKELNVTILNGLLVLWLVTAIGGGILFLSIYALYRSVYNRQRAVESQFAQFAKDQDRIIQIEKLSAVGQMVTEIAHQLNNPLVGVINLAALAEREVDNPDRLRELLKDVQGAGKHCRDFVQRMLRLNAAAKSEPRPTDVAELARETIELFKQSLGRAPEIVMEMPSAAVVIEVDPVLLRHALFNLLQNAAQSDPQGPIVVSLAMSERAGSPGCSLSVRDSGKGLSPEAIARLFTPFFTTRAGGTGLGLFVAQQIVVRHSGNLDADNPPGGGARFVIWLPLRPAQLGTPGRLPAASEGTPPA